MPRQVADIDAEIASVQEKQAGAQIVWQDMGNIMDACRAELTRLSREKAAVEEGKDVDAAPGLAELIAKGEANLKGKLEDVVAESTSAETEEG